MNVTKEALRVVSCGNNAVYAAQILDRQLRQRGCCGTLPTFTLTLCDGAGFEDEDVFEIERSAEGFLFRANGTRGLIYATGLFLRKTRFCDDSAALCCDITGIYRPKKPIRGHQLGYRPCSNTYDAWDEKEFETYMTELMFFGMNTVEFIPFAERNALMKRTGTEMTALLSTAAHRLGLDVSLWIPNTDKSETEELREREELFRAVPYIDAVFIPGSDPGSLPAGTMLDRCNKLYDILKRYHPDAKIWPSAQAPHYAPAWGEEFLAALEHAGPGIAGIITGPNRAFNIDVLRARLPEKYPIRFYPDVTHNLRCEHPVHFDRDDWHYAFSTALSRESINPRPVEYKRLFDTVSHYTVGSVTYSDGVNDDVNKTVWCALEWDDTQTAEEIVEDYARAYLYDYDTDAAAAAILLLERNWRGSPLEKLPDFTAHVLDTLSKEQNCWRFTQLWFRALCDLYVKQRLTEDSAAAGTAAALIDDRQTEAAISVLRAPRSERLSLLRGDIDRLAVSLNNSIGMQLSVERFGASGWERGATLDTLDLPVTDKEWLLYVTQHATDDAEMTAAVHRNDVKEGEFYFSVALHGLEALKTLQEPDFYMNFQGDRPDVNNGTLPVCLQKVFDHTVFKAKIDGLENNVPYDLTVTYFKPDETFLKTHTVMVNGTLLQAPETNKKLTGLLMPARYCAYTYRIPAGAITDGTVQMEIREPVSGFQTAEFRITHTEDDA